MTRLERAAYLAGRRDHGTQRPADCPEDLPRWLGEPIPADQLGALYIDHYARGYNEAYRESLGAR